MRLRRITATIAALALPVAAFVPASPASAEPLPPGMSVNDLAGIALLPARPDVPAPLPAKTAATLDSATKLAAAHPRDLGYPWVDRTTGEVVTATTTDTGDTLAVRGSRRRHVRYGYARLEKIKYDVTFLTEKTAPDSSSIVATVPDPQHDRIVIWANHLTPRLMRSLADRYGTRAIAVRYVPGLNPSRTASQSRLHDGPTYFGGGAWINMYDGSGAEGCTSGIPWYYDDKSQMITAGHCAHAGAYVTAGSSNEITFGSVRTGTDENWDEGVGTVKLPGQTVFRGDISRIQMSRDGDTSSSAAHSGYYVFKGNGDSSSVRVISQMWDRRAQYGDEYCTDGSRSYEVCSWTVLGAGSTWRYTGDPGQPYARNVVIGIKNTGKCVIPGDSGGPTYTVKSDGTVAVKGIISGASMGYSTGSAGNPCYNVFTDAYDVMAAFGGGPRWIG